MKEQFISYKTALLAQEKGFDIICGEESYFKNNASDGWDSERIEKPTQSLLQKWLRDKHKIFIYCVPRGFEKCDGKKIIRWANNISIRKNKFSSTYEKALEFHRPR